ncbi:hypothetical protein DFH07DRAFT_1025428 [Mycena maculata]|uniref:DUF642 domain-containing protein n=1 Tax=Mycena maculata TaxID=230809 RepID=A0AAD7J6H8_9AGAR|nr:hypothetical protein DFH07DRAFT_1025428 [Mycena maculata]
MRCPHLQLTLCLIFALLVDGEATNLLSNPTFQSSSNGSVPDDWSLRGTGGLSGLQGTTTKAVYLSSMDPNNPSVLFQGIETSTGVDYQLGFNAFCTDAGTGQQNLTVSFGAGTWSVQPPGSWQTYTFSARGKGTDDQVAFSSVDTSGGGSNYIYDVSLVSLGVDNSPLSTTASGSSSSASNAPTVLPSPSGSTQSDSASGSNALSEGAEIATIIGPIIAVIAIVMATLAAWYKREEIKRREFTKEGEYHPLTSLPS